MPPSLHVRPAARTGILLAGIGLLLLAAPGAPGAAPARPTAARPSAAAQKAARAHFRQGKAYHDAGVYADAIREYEKAYALVPLPELLFNIGQAHRLSGARAQAIAAYERYLQAVPEGELADEARTHVAMLRARIQLEASEAARRRAEAEAAEARRRAAAAEAEAEARRKARAATDEALLRRLAEQQAARERQRLALARAERERRLATAEARGRTTRRVGVGLMVSGAVSVAAWAVVLGVFIPDAGKISTFTDTKDAPWSSALERTDNRLRPMVFSMIGLIGAGVGLLVTGGIIHAVGQASRTRARDEALRSVEILPSLGPGSGGVLVQGRF